MSLSYAFFFWIAQILLPQGLEPDTPEGSFLLSVDGMSLLLEVERSEQGFRILPPPGVSEDEIVYISIDAAGQVRFEDAFDEEDVDLTSLWAERGAPPVTLPELIEAHCGSSDPTPECGIVYSEDEGLLSLWDRSNRFDLFWIEDSLPAVLRCFDSPIDFTLTDLIDRGVDVSAFQRVEAFTDGVLLDSGTQEGQEVDGAFIVWGWSVDLVPGQRMVQGVQDASVDPDMIVFGPDGCALPEIRASRFVSEVQASEAGAHVLVLAVGTPLNPDLPVVIELAGDAERHSRGEELDDGYAFQMWDDEWDDAWDDDIDWENFRGLPEGLTSEGRTLAVGTAGEGTFLSGGTAFTTGGGHPLQAWSLSMAEGQTVTLDLRSDDFDAYLYLAGGSLSSPVEDDDGGEGLDSRIVYTSEAGGDYLVVASAFGQGSTGAYTLEAREGDFGFEEDGWDDGFWDDEPWGRGRDLPEDLEAQGRVLGLDGEAQGRLLGSSSPYVTSGGHPLEAWGLELESGQTVTLDLRSDAFDAYLYLTGGSLSVPVEDDDGGEGLNSQIVYTSEAGGMYLVVASSFGEGSTGSYTLEARAGDFGFAEDDFWDDGFWEDEEWASEDPSLWDSRSLPVPLDAQGRQLGVPGEAEGVLDFEIEGVQQAMTEGGQLVKAWELVLLPGQQVQIDLMSDDFDAYLYLVPDEQTGLPALEDDDGGETTDSRLLYRSEAGGTYLVVVSSFWQGETGRYRLQVTNESGFSTDSEVAGQ